MHISDLSHRLPRLQATSCYHIVSMRRKSGLVNDCQMPAEPTGLKAGSTSTKTRLQRISVKAAGTSMAAKSCSGTVKKTCD